MKRALFFIAIAVLIVCGNLFAASQQTGSTTANTIIARARALANEPDETFVSDAQMLVWVNSGTRDIVAKTKCLEVTKEVSLVTGQAEYIVSGVNYYSILGLVYKDPDGLYSDPSKTRKGMTLGNPWSAGHTRDKEPTYWYEFGKNGFGVYPALSTVSGESVILYMVTRPTDVTSSAEVLVPAIYENALTQYVAAKIAARNKQMGSYQAFMSAYDKELELYSKEYDSRYKLPEVAVQ